MPITHEIGITDNGDYQNNLGMFEYLEKSAKPGSIRDITGITMPDIMTVKQRSERMSLVKNKNSKPECLVRSLLHRMGFRYCLHNSHLPGKPDIVLTRHKKIVLMHGCYWHRHGVCRRLSIPENNPDFWLKKFEENIERDKQNIHHLNELGWNVLVVWECETKEMKKLKQILTDFMNSKA